MSTEQLNFQKFKWWWMMRCISTFTNKGLKVPFAKIDSKSNLEGVITQYEEDTRLESGIFNLIFFILFFLKQHAMVLVYFSLFKIN